MYDVHNSTDTFKFWTEKQAINKTFLFFIRFWWKLVLQSHQVSLKSDEKQNISCPFFYLGFQSVSRIVKIVHCVHNYLKSAASLNCTFFRFYCIVQRKTKNRLRYVIKKITISFRVSISYRSTKNILASSDNIAPQNIAANSF